MKKVFKLSMMCFLALLTCAVIGCEDDNEETSGEYVDLGLPSGTKWKDKNESTFYSYDQAIQNFGDNIPTKEQFEELQASCMWTWTDSGYKVVGPNGKSIVLPAAGFRGCYGGVYNVGSYGYYWSSTPNGSEEAWDLNFGSGGVHMGSTYRCYGQSVRLVQD